MTLLRKIRRDKQDRTSITIPAFLRDKFDLRNGDEVEVDVESSRIVIVPKRRVSQ